MAGRSFLSTECPSTARSNGTQNAGEVYGVANQTILAHPINWHFPEPIPLRTSNLRAPGDVARCFASECFIDEIAVDLKVDPGEFRLQHLADNRRGKECLKAAVEKAQWQKRPSPAPDHERQHRQRSRCRIDPACEHLRRHSRRSRSRQDNRPSRGKADRLLPRLRPHDQPGRREKSGGKQYHSRGEPGVVRGRHLRRQRRDEPRLGQLSNIAFSRFTQARHRLDQSSGYAAPRRR